MSDLDIVGDRCSECFELLKRAPLGGRYVCEKHPRAAYWSPAIPEGGPDKARLVSKRGRPTLYYYGGYFS